MVKKSSVAPNNVHWMEYRLKNGDPIGNGSNFIKISPENLAKLKKAIKTKTPK